jgi:hypothetical protein
MRRSPVSINQSPKLVFSLIVTSMHAKLSVANKSMFIPLVDGADLF